MPTVSPSPVLRAKILAASVPFVLIVLFFSFGFLSVFLLRARGSLGNLPSVYSRVQIKVAVVEYLRGREDRASAARSGACLALLPLPPLLAWSRLRV